MSPKSIAPDREQIGRFSAQHEDPDREEQCERYGRGDDQRAAQVAQEHPLQQENQRDAERHIVQDGLGRDVDQVLAVIDPLDADARRQDVRIVDALDFALDPLDRRHALLAATHQHDALDDVVIRIVAGDAEARLLPDRDGGHVTDQHRIAVALRQHRVAQVLDRANKPDAPHHRRLRADIDGVAADIDVAVVQRLQQLRQGQPIGNELVEIDLELECLGLAAPSDDVDDSRHRAEAALQHPVLQGLEIEHAVAGGTDQPVAEDFADRTDRRNLRLRVVRQRRNLRQPVEHQLQRLLIGQVERELQLHVGQAVKRNRADRGEVAQAGGLRLDGDGDVALDLLGRETGALRDHVHHRRRRVGIGLDVELAERHDAAREHHHEQHDHQNAMFEGKGDDCIHGNASVARAMV